MQHAICDIYVLPHCLKGLYALVFLLYCTRIATCPYPYVRVCLVGAGATITMKKSLVPFKFLKPLASPTPDGGEGIRTLGSYQSDAGICPPHAHRPPTHLLHLERLPAPTRHPTSVVATAWGAGRGVRLKPIQKCGHGPPHRLCLDVGGVCTKGGNGNICGSTSEAGANVDTYVEMSRRP
jgi:hypothetical protein